MRKPNLFLVGTQRSGSSSLCSYLGQHPDIFMGLKEILYFGSDLDTIGRRLTLEEYEAFFADARDERWVGDGSVGYIYSASAAAEIKAYSSEARILVTLRSPVDMAYSLHSLLWFQGLEPEPSFAKAVDDDALRYAYSRTAVRWGFRYRDAMRYASQVERYFDVFGRERVHVVLYEDLAADPGAVYRSILEFLEVDPVFRPMFSVENANRRPKLGALNRLVRAPSPAMKRLARLVVPARAGRLAVGRWLTLHNQRYDRRVPLDAGLRSRLEAQCADDVDRLETMLGRDLSVWRQTAQAATGS